MKAVYVQGSSVRRTWRDSRRSLTELIFDCVAEALARAGRRAADVDSVVLAAHDLVDGRSLSSMVTAPAAAAYLKDEVRLADDAAVAFVLGSARIRSGSSRVTVVAGWGRASEGQPDRIANALFDPFFTRPLGMTELAVSALRASAALRAHPGYERWRGPVSAIRRSRTTPEGAWPAAPAPLRETELPCWGDVVAAAVLSSDPGPVEVRGVGMSTEAYQVGDRDLLGVPSLRSASAAALAMAGRPIAEVDVLELDGLTAFDDALALEAIGAATTGDGMRVLAERPRLNADGGSAAGYCAPAMGLVRICNAFQQLAVEEGSLALATGANVVAGQSHTAAVLARA
jgi:hypothetical protein